MQKITLLNLYLIFVKIGAILLGGGYVILPIITNEFAEKRKLFSSEEIVNYFTISQSLPGIIAANISMFIGYKLHGKRGAIIAMLGIITIPFICIISLASLLDLLTQNKLIQGAFWGIGIAVISLIILTIREIWQNTNKDVFFYSIFTLALTALLFFNFSPIKTILIFTLLGILYKILTTPKEVKWYT